MPHVRADLDDDTVERLARSYGTRLLMNQPGPAGSLRRTATDAGTPTITVEMGAAHRFERDLVAEGVDGVESVCQEFGLHEGGQVRWPGWHAVIADDSERRWIRADADGVVQMHVDSGALVHEGDPVCTITNPFSLRFTEVEAPFAGLVVGNRLNPVGAGASARPRRASARADVGDHQAASS